MTTTTDIIQIEDLAFRYGEGEFELMISAFSVPAEQQLAIIGASGCGKTSLLMLIAGVHRPLRGKLTVLDQNLTQLTDAQRRNFRIRNIGLVFQQQELIDYLTVLDNILLPYRINPSMQLTPVIKERAAQLAADMGVQNHLRRHPTQLSQGERQRVAIARALLPKPKLLLADEPTGNLDPSRKQQVRELMTTAAREIGATLIFVTHNEQLLGGFERVVDLNTICQHQPVSEASHA